MSDQDPRTVPVLKHYYRDTSENRRFDLSGLSFNAEDGWPLRATLHEPTGQLRQKAPAVILMAEPGLRLRNIFGVLAQPLAEMGCVVLSLDMRGSGSSYGPKDFEKFTPAEIENLQLDVHAAVSALCAKSNVDPNRIGILAPGITAEYAVREAAQSPNIRALGLMTPNKLSSTALDIIRRKTEVPVLAILGRDQPKALQRDWAEPYLCSENAGSRLVFGVDQGPTMLHRIGGLIETIVAWFDDNLASLPIQRAVTFTSDGGWKLCGTVYLPSRHNGQRVPGAVFAHGLNHSEQSWGTIPDEVARKGIATLALDWRGTRKSINPGRPEIGVDMEYDDFQSIYRDVKTAMDHLASYDEVDPSRLGLVSATAVCNHIVRAAIGDDRVKSLVTLSFFMPAPDVCEYLRNNDVPIFVVASTEDVNPGGSSLADSSRLAYESSKSKRSQFLLYDDAGRGNGMPFAKPELRGMITRWLDETLAK
jgi:cephalosporin-C deacetylase-like acetyl esterase